MKKTSSWIVGGDRAGGVKRVYSRRLLTIDSFTDRSFTRRIRMMLSVLVPRFAYYDNANSIPMDKFISSAFSPRVIQTMYRYDFTRVAVAAC